MRLGQAVCDVVTLPSDPEIKLSIVPLTEAEYLQALERVRDVKANDDLAGVTIRDRVQAQEIVLRAIREPDDLTKQIYDTTDEMLQDLEVGDIDALIDGYNEMVSKASPTLDGIPEEEMAYVKKTLLETNWSVLSGRSWYAAKRFLSSLSPELLQGNSPGSGSINSSTTTKD